VFAAGYWRCRGRYWNGGIRDRYCDEDPGLLGRFRCIVESGGVGHCAVSFAGEMMHDNHCVRCLMILVKLEVIIASTLFSVG